MKVRLAGSEDLGNLADLWSRIENAMMYGNRRFLRDLVSRLYRLGAVMVVAEDGKLVGGMVLAHSTAIRKVISLYMASKALFGLYGSPIKLLTGLADSRRFMKLIDSSYHGLFVYVEPDYREKGLSLEMWRTAAGRIDGKITLLIDEKNNISAKWAERAGFKLVGKSSFGGKKFALYSKETEMEQ